MEEKPEFAPDIVLVEITDRNPQPQEGWDYKDGEFIEPHISVEELLANIRLVRDRLLAECDWTQLPDTMLTDEEKTAWAQYRQALRDFPETCDPYNPVWPVRPK